jgi:hypothetical protein
MSTFHEVILETGLDAGPSGVDRHLSVSQVPDDRDGQLTGNGSSRRRAQQKAGGAQVVASNCSARLSWDPTRQFGRGVGRQNLRRALRDSRLDLASLPALPGETPRLLTLVGQAPRLWKGDRSGFRERPSRAPPSPAASSAGEKAARGFAESRKTENFDLIASEGLKFRNFANSVSKSQSRVQPQFRIIRNIPSATRAYATLWQIPK